MPPKITLGGQSIELLIQQSLDRSKRIAQILSGTLPMREPLTAAEKRSQLFVRAQKMDRNRLMMLMAAYEIGACEFNEQNARASEAATAAKQNALVMEKRSMDHMVAMHRDMARSVNAHTREALIPIIQKQAEVKATLARAGFSLD